MSSTILEDHLPVLNLVLDLAYEVLVFILQLRPSPLVLVVVLGYRISKIFNDCT